MYFGYFFCGHRECKRIGKLFDTVTKKKNKNKKIKPLLFPLKNPCHQIKLFPFIIIFLCCNDNVYFKLNKIKLMLNKF